MTVTNELINQLIKTSDFPEDAYSKMMEQRVDQKELEQKLCNQDKEINWITRKKINR